MSREHNGVSLLAEPLSFVLDPTLALNIAKATGATCLEDLLRILPESVSCSDFVRLSDYDGDPERPGLVAVLSTSLPIQGIEIAGAIVCDAGGYIARLEFDESSIAVKSLMAEGNAVAIWGGRTQVDDGTLVITDPNAELRMADARPGSSDFAQIMEFATFPIPVYPKFESLSANSLTRAIRQALEHLGERGQPAVPSRTREETLIHWLFRVHMPFSRDGFESAVWTIRALDSIPPKAWSQQANPEQVTFAGAQIIRTARDAEETAARHLQALGFHDAAATDVGADGGIDVSGTGVVAQVKMQGVPVTALPLQAIYGVGAATGRTPVFYSLSGYTADAKRWADTSLLALFEFDYSGGVQATNNAARELARTSP